MRSVSIALVAAGALLAGAFAWTYRWHLNSDACVYLELARCWAAGDLRAATVGYWGPLLPALIALPVAAGAPLVAAGKAVALVAVAAWLVACRAWLGRFLPPRRAGLAVAVGAFPPLLVIGAAYSVLPDALLSLAGVGVAAALVSDARRPRPLAALVAGAACGAAYLCKPPSWILLLPAAAAAVAWSRRRVPSRAASSALALAALAAGFALVAGPWIAAVSWRTGGFTLGTATGELLALNNQKLGLPHPPFRQWLPDEGRLELVHNPWILRLDGPARFDPRLALQRLPGNAAELGRFSLASPLFLAGLGASAWRFRRALASRSRWVVPAFALGLTGALFVRAFEARWLVYALPFALLEAARFPVPAFVPRWATRGRVLVAVALVAAAFTARHFPRRPLGEARARHAREVAAMVPPDARVWMNSMAWGMPTAFLMERRVTRVPPWADPAAGGPPPDLVAWGEAAGRPGTGFDPARVAGYGVVREWTDEDGLVMRILRRDP
jgi:hypothetical protein